MLADVRNYGANLAMTGAGVKVGAVAETGDIKATTAATVFPSKVTAPRWASARPCNVAPVASEIDLCARMFPYTTDVDPRVAELPTTQ